MKVLITGASGFLGGWLVKGCLSKGMDVRILSRPKSDLTLINGLKFEKAIGDVTDAESLVTATRDCDAVIHAAAIIAYSEKDRPQMERVNIGGTQNVLNACEKNKVRKMVLTSSVVTIGATTTPLPLNEDAEFNLSKYNFGYHDTKRKAELLAQDYSKRGRVDCVVVNPSVMFGPGDALKSSRKTHLKVANGKFPFYPPGGCNIVSVKDVVEGHILAMEKGRSGQRYILSGDNVTIRQLFNEIAKLNDVAPPRIPLPKIVLRSVYRAGKILKTIRFPIQMETEAALIATLFHWYDNSKAKSELGFTPKPGTESLKESIQWARQHQMI